MDKILNLIARIALRYRNWQTDRRIQETGLAKNMVDFEGTRFSYYGIETGKPPLFMLHGFLDSARTFRRIFPLLISRFDIYAIDMPGFGDSTLPPVREVWHIDSMSRSLSRFILHLLEMRSARFGMRAKGSKKEPVQVFTHSMGGLIAMHMLLQYQKLKIPTPFKKIHMIAPGALRFPKEERDAHRRRFYPTSVSEIRELLTELFHDTRTDIPDFILRGILAEWSGAGYSYLAENTIEREDEVFFAPTKRLNLKTDICLYWGKDDRIVTLNYGKLLRMTLRCKLVEIPGGHCPQVENPDELTARFLENAL